MIKFRQLIAWIEDQKIRQYRIEDRSGLREVDSDNWSQAFHQVIIHRVIISIAGCVLRHDVTLTYNIKHYIVFSTYQTSNVLSMKTNWSRRWIGC